MRGKEEHGKVKMTDSGLVIPALTVIVGQACTLKCKHCANFSPFAPDSVKRYPLEQLCGNLQVIFQSVHRLEKVQVQGGEPFLYTQLPELLDFIRASGKVDLLTVATNGTIVPDARVLQAMQRNQVRVRISNYTSTSAETVIQLTEQLKEYGLDIWIYEFASDDSMWYDMGGITEAPETAGEDALQQRFMNCPFHDCFTLENGKISRCGRAVMAGLLQGFTAREQDLLPVAASEDFALKLWRYLDLPAYMEACRYCYGTERGKVLPAQQLEA